MNIGQFLNEDNGAVDTEYQGDVIVDIVAANEANMELQEVMIIESQLSNAYDTLAAAAADRADAIVSGNESAGDASLDARMEATVAAVVGTLGIGDQIVAGNESAEEKGQGLMSKIWAGIVNAVKTIWKKIKDFFKAVGKMLKGLFSSNKTSADKMQELAAKIDDDAVAGAFIIGDKAKKVKNALPMLFMSGKLDYNAVSGFIEGQSDLVLEYGKGKIYDTLLGKMDEIYTSITKNKLMPVADMREMIAKTLKTITSEFQFDLGEVYKDHASVMSTVNAVAKAAKVDVKDVLLAVTEKTSKHTKVLVLAVDENGKIRSSEAKMVISESILEKAAVQSFSKDDLKKITKELTQAVNNVKKVSDSLEKKINDGEKDVGKVLDLISKNIDSSVVAGGDKILMQSNVENLKIVMKDILPKLFSGAMASLTDLVNSKIPVIAEISNVKKGAKEEIKVD